jgi:hypothetical protein
MTRNSAGIAAFDPLFAESIKTTNVIIQATAIRRDCRTASEIT